MESTSSTLVPVRRRHRSLDEARELVARWRASGSGKEAWCRAQGILRSTLQSALLRVEPRLEGANDARPGGSFIAVRCGEPEALAATVSVTLDLGGGVRALGLDAAGLAALVRALRSEVGR